MDIHVKKDNKGNEHPLGGVSRTFDELTQKQQDTIITTKTVLKEFLRFHDLMLGTDLELDGLIQKGKHHYLAKFSDDLYIHCIKLHKNLGFPGDIRLEDVERYPKDDPFNVIFDENVGDIYLDSKEFSTTPFFDEQYQTHDNATIQLAERCTNCKVIANQYNYRDREIEKFVHLKCEQCGGKGQVLTENGRGILRLINNFS